MNRLVCSLAVLVLASLTSGCRSASPVAPATRPPSRPPLANAVAIMGPARLSAEQLASWFALRAPQPPGDYAATVPAEALASYYLEEGAAEGVAGDVAFMQAVLETGWFRFGGTITGTMNNFAGIGATDTNPEPAGFPDARTGVRAQIQHLRAYADPAASTCTAPPLGNPCVDPRFSLVVPKGKAPTWNQLGNGNWATSTTYATGILGLYADALAFHGLR